MLVPASSLARTYDRSVDCAFIARADPGGKHIRNHVRAGQEASAAELLVDRANLLTLIAPEMKVLIGGLRALGANVGKSPHGEPPRLGVNA